MRLPPSPAVADAPRRGGAPDETGASSVAPAEKQGAAMLSGFPAGEGFAVIAEDVARIEPGQPIPFLPFAALLA